MEMISLFYALSCIALAAACFFAWRKGKAPARWKAALPAAALLLLLAAFFFAWLSDFYRADSDAGRYLVSTGGVTVERSANGWRFDGPGEAAALIFYPGAKVEASAYAPLLFRLAEGGVDAFLVKMPFNIAFFNKQAADRLIGSYRYESWWYAFLSVYGDRDGVLNFERYEAKRAYWPRNARELVIPGGNHAQFGSYGRQSGDGEAAIGREEQQQITVDAILRWIDGQRAGKE